MKLLIAGGGTGGHVFTGIAVAHELKRRSSQHDIVFVGSEKGMESRLVPQAGFSLHKIAVKGFKRMGLKGKMLSLVTLPLSFWEAMRLLFSVKPDVVFGVGGYASFPVVFMAKWFGIPTAIIEQNSVPGLTNRLLGHFVRRIFLAFAHAEKYFPAMRCYLTGNPVRNELAEKAARGERTKSNGRLRLLVFGGSQGAERIDQVMAEAAALLREQSNLFSIRHQASARTLDMVKKVYEENGFEHEVSSFIDDMGSAYSHNDLILCRAGALSLTEIAYLGKPAILIPYPYAADNHQEENAREFAEAGAAMMIRERDLTGFALAEVLREFARNRERLEKMHERSLALSKPRATLTIVDHLQVMTGSSGHS